MVDIWIAVNVTRPMKFTAFIAGSVGKINQFPVSHWGFKSYLNLQEKDFEQKFIFFVIISFSFRLILSKFTRKQSCSVSHFKYVVYV